MVLGNFFFFLEVEFPIAQNTANDRLFLVIFCPQTLGDTVTKKVHGMLKNCFLRL